MRTRPPVHGWSAQYLASPWNAVAAGALQLTPLWYGGGTRVVDLKRQVTGTLTGTPVWTPDRSGAAGLVFDGSTNVISGMGSLVGDADAFTMLVVVSTASAATDLIAMSEGASAATSQVVWLGMGRTSGGKPSFSVGDNAAVYDEIGGSTNINDSKVHVLVGRQNTKSSRDLWVDGVKVATGSVTVGALTLNRGSIGAADVDSAFLRFFNGTIYMTASWRYALPDAALARLGTDPWLLVRAQARKPQGFVAASPPSHDPFVQIQWSA